MRVTLIEKPKEGKQIQRTETHDIGLAEKMLKKGGWDIKDKDKFVFIDGKISTITKRPSKKTHEKRK
ncbi:hypothetical protein EP331_00370 [bacterium]|nr:MAG: hypothetical protein EP331_00370 [bacterium]